MWHNSEVQTMKVDIFFRMKYGMHVEYPIIFRLSRLFQMHEQNVLCYQKNFFNINFTIDSKVDYLYGYILLLFVQ